MRVRIYGLVFLFWLLPGAGHAQYEVGKHYVKLPVGMPVEAGEQIEVREFFWYGCPHCYALEPYLESWLKRRPNDVLYVRTPGVSRNWLPHAHAYYTFEAFGITEKVHTDFFDAIHKQRKKLDDAESLAEFLQAYGVDPEQVRKAYNSFGVNTKVERAKQVNFRYGIDSVPMLTVDGRYKTSVIMAGGPTELMVLIDYLIEQSREERKRATGSKN